MSRRSRSRGVTPVAAAVLIAMLGAGASCLWWLRDLGVGKDADNSSRADATLIQTAAKSYRAQHADGCPTLSLLEEERFLGRDTRGDDAWGDRFRVLCQDDEISVSSAGADGKRNTADDIRVPR